MNRNYRTHARNFIDKYHEAIYQPDKKLIESLHQVLDTLPESKAMAIDYIVGDLMRLEGYGQPIRFRKEHPHELIDNISKGE